DQARLESMETQIRALTAQVEQLANEIRAGGGRRSDAAQPGGFGDAFGATASSQFGSTTVTSAHPDPIGELVGADQPGLPSSFADGYSDPVGQAPPASRVTEQAALSTGAAGAGPKQLYE